MKTLKISSDCYRKICRSLKRRALLPCKHSSWWRRLEYVFSLVFRRRLQDVLIKTNIFDLAIRLQDVFKTFLRCLTKPSLRRFQDIFKTSCKNIFKTSSRRFEDVSKTSSRRLAKTSSRRLQNALEKRIQDIFKTFWKRLQDVFETSCKDVFKTFSKPIIKLN